jgi:hypothetical protein
MAKARKVWTYRPAKPRAPTVPADVKADVRAQAQHLIATVLGPAHIKPPPTNPRFNYLVAIASKWWRHYFYFTATYAVPGPNALVPSFEDAFARLEYVGGDRFHLAFRRHTGEWITVYRDQSLADCLSAITTDPWFLP